MKFKNLSVGENSPPKSNQEAEENYTATLQSGLNIPKQAFARIKTIQIED